MKHDYIMEAITADGRRFTMYGSFANCAVASERAWSIHPDIRSLTTNLIVAGKTIKHYII